MFLESSLVEAPKKTVDNNLKREGKEMTELDVVNRFSKLYKSLPNDKKAEFNSFF
jgi:hypothetical protein